MAKLRVGINGFGRIGRVLFRAGFEEVEIVGINTLDSLDGVSHLLKYDSTHGRFKGDVKHDEKNLFVNGQKINIAKNKNPAEIPWSDWGVDLVLECTGAFKKKEEFLLHKTAGAKKVMVSAPADGADLTIVYGINHESYNPSQHDVISNASCTTNCLAPLAKVLHETFGIENGVMTTVHSYTNDQQVLDASHKDLRRARSAAVSMIPTTTGAAKAVGLVLPQLKGKIDGVSVRVPTPNVSLVDFTFNTQKEVSVAAINAALTQAAQNQLKGILAVESEELVSVDYNGNTHSSIVDLPNTMVVGPRTAKVMSWYDNETGFSHRMIDLVKYMAERGL
ncbi:MAG: type I glyceraldehyde-3-phosphate dehydrogenase [Proteobacteria bacterium]|jgi:glyceraldehyde 3-phosphate dehydrogenase|nr:type I glyceraldehyde-3-phosphate dehydrogenase [Pseudomonadota bacterium]